MSDISSAEIYIRYITGVTQLLVQVNQKLNFFSSSTTINREGFLIILANFWPTWASKETIQKAGKKVVISSSGLSVD